MATTRFSLIQWDDDTAAVDRTQFNDAFASIDNLGAGYTQTTGAPAAASADKVGFLHFNTTDDTLFYCDGSSWQQINLFANTTNSTISAVTPGDSKSAGASTDVAKADHVHEMPDFGAISNLASSATSTNGSAATFSRSDHVHGIPNGTISNDMLAGSITGSKLVNGTVTTTQIGSNTITGNNINSSTTITAATYLVGGDDGLTSVSGSYGSVQTAGSGASGYEGYSIGGHAVFMSENSTSSYGLYDDANNQWGVASDRLGGTKLYYNGTQKLITTSAGATVTGSVTATTFNGALAGNATSAGTATNLSGGSVAATTISASSSTSLAGLTVSQDANFDSGTLFVDVSSNRVGIRDTSPSHALDVDGTIRATGNVRGDQLLIGNSDDGLKVVTGDYGSVQTAGSGAGGYEGYSIAGHAVFMASSSSSQFGLYDDANSKWGISIDRLGGTKLYYNGAQKLVTSNTGATVTGTLTATAFNGTLDGDDLTTGTVAAAQIDTAIARLTEVYGFGSGSDATYNITTGSGSGTPSSSVHPNPNNGDIHIWY